MPNPFSEDRLLLGKALSLVEKGKDRLKQIDKESFPTPASEIARFLCLESIEAILNSPNLSAMSPPSMFLYVQRLHNFIDDIENSHLDHISWPLVNHCDELWKKIFPDEGPALFYSITRSHNYLLSHFSTKLLGAMEPLLTADEKSGFRKKEVYCLHLSSLEEDNLPFYANIAHEFGHAVIAAQHDSIKLLWQECISPLSQRLEQKAIEGGQDVSRLGTILWKIAQEIFADLFAAYAFGLTFYLSLFELRWQDQVSNRFWQIDWHPMEESIMVHPGVDYRLFLLQEKIQLSAWAEIAATSISGLENKSIASIITWMSAIKPDHSKDEFIISNPPDGRANILCEILQNNIAAIKDACHHFADQAWDRLQSSFASIRCDMKADKLYHLLKRMENDIIPNIYPLPDQADLLGEPAELECILAAAAIYRLWLLDREDDDFTSRNRRHELSKVERMTRKAIEVVYIQRQYLRSSG
jgi:hypothetical protein